MCGYSPGRYGQGLRPACERLLLVKRSLLGMLKALCARQDKLRDVLSCFDLIDRLQC
jgi:hypothetical protein